MRHPAPGRGCLSSAQQQESVLPPSRVGSHPATYSTPVKPLWQAPGSLGARIACGGPSPIRAFDLRSSLLGGGHEVGSLGSFWLLGLTVLSFSVCLHALQSKSRWGLWARVADGLANRAGCRLGSGGPRPCIHDIPGGTLHLTNDGGGFSCGLRALSMPTQRRALFTVYMALLGAPLGGGGHAHAGLRSLGPFWLLSLSDGRPCMCRCCCAQPPPA